jgi:NAD(P)-dependent dehydrogenase (short-subunit alcohol dehydrogenase family)
MSSLQRFTGRKVIITGAGSGIGQATVARLLAEGATVAAMDVSDAGLAVTTQAAIDAGTNDRLSTSTIDVGSEASVKAAMASAIKSLGGLDVLVNAAGVLRTSHTADTSLEFWDTIIRVNLTGTFLATREALPALLASGAGVVVNFSSTSANFAHPDMAA